MEVTIKRIVNWTFPYFGNVHIMPYGELEVTDGVDTKICKTKGDKYTDNEGYQYITFKRKRYLVCGTSSLRNGIDLYLTPIL